MGKIGFFLLIMMTSLLALATTREEAILALKKLPIQDGGRIKPFDTFTRESLALIYGREKFEKKPAIEIVTTWVLLPQLWQERKIFEVKFHALKQALKLNPEATHFSFAEIMQSDRLSVVFQDLQSRREIKEKLNPFYQAVQRLESQLGLFRAIGTGHALRIIPSKSSSTWHSINEMQSLENSDELQKSFELIGRGFVATLAHAQTAGSGPSGTVGDLATGVERFKKATQAIAPEVYPKQGKIDAEVFYQSFHPFQKAWIIYFLALLCIALNWVLKKKLMYRLSWILASVGLIFHILGFALRVYITERAPVSNMYETVVWVGFGAIIFAMIMEVIYRWHYLLAAGSLVAGFCLLLSDLAPVVLDPSLQPLEAVLNSNFWLTTHVLTITISYAAFFLAFALGDISLFLFLRGADENDERIRALTLSMYRSLQIGVALLAPGIILGGVWADYSWGRFWGWDPKETWALIALMGYVAVLHARMAGWIKGYGMAVVSILTFNLVIMAWYGVNFVLGAGLHSYGFGAGGIEYVLSFVAVHIFYIGWSFVARKGGAKFA